MQKKLVAFFYQFKNKRFLKKTVCVLFVTWSLACMLAIQLPMRSALLTECKKPFYTYSWWIQQSPAWAMFIQNKPGEYPSNCKIKIEFLTTDNKTVWETLPSIAKMSPIEKLLVAGKRKKFLDNIINSKEHLPALARFLLREERDKKPEMKIKKISIWIMYKIIENPSIKFEPFGYDDPKDDQYIIRKIYEQNITPVDYTW